MRLRTLGIAALLSASLYQQSEAVVRPKDAEAPVVSNGRGPRDHRSVAYAKSTQLGALGLAGWTAIWDRDTDVPLRMWSSGSVISGSNTNPAIAEAAARQFLAAHLAVLAPGAAVTDFELVSNQLGGNGEVRSVGFVQRASGIRVQGGTIGFAFKRDRLVMVSSTALPNVVVSVPTQRLAPTEVARAATRWLATGGQVVAARAVSNAVATERVIIPIVRPRRGPAIDVTYRVAEQVAVDSTTGPGRWNVYVDAASASPIARRTTISYASGKVLFNVPDRGPQGTRNPQPARATHVVDGVATLAALDGTVTWSGTAAATVALKLTGPLVAISNGAGAVFAETLQLAANGTLLWSHPTEEAIDAQLDAFIYANQVKAFAKAKINPGLAYLDQQLSVTVNESGSCNAFSTGDDVHFFPRSQQCENTGRLADVVYHEFGHSLHANSIIDGVGAFDGSLSEGLADTTAVLITGDPGMGRGFFFDNSALRNLEPATPKRFPEDADGEPHDEGEIIGEALWDTRKALEAKLGPAAGLTKTIAIYYGIMQRAADIPSSYAEALLADDDDGDLTNGTPNRCEIDAAFARHGLSDPSVSLGLGSPVRDGFNVSIKISPPAGGSACPSASVTSAVVDWNLRGTAGGGQIPLTAAGETFAGDIPSQPDGTVVQYKVTITLSDNSTVVFPNNPADPLYEFYVGPVTTLYCTDFESGAADWTKGGEWEAGAPAGLGGDPKTAFGGANVFGLDLTQDGVYTASSTTFAESPEIDLKGNTQVRLQYQRWLGVEDGFYDQAQISANGTPVWNNFTSQTDPQFAEVNHQDREWRFQDVDLSAQTATGKLKLRFDLTSDQGLELGGWTMDDVCVVALSGAALTCGNGAVDTGETCDDGNRVDGDGCSANCLDESETQPGGCCSVGSGPEGALALGVLTLGLVLRRRRRA
jgi:MYXO-CTERM domain-containing protein